MAELKEYFRHIVLFFITIEARLALWRFNPRIIMVTGSVGKTSTKDAVFTALSGSVFVRKSEKGFNSDIGVPLTVLGLKNGWSNLAVWVQNLARGILLLSAGAPYPAWLVIEVGADRPGDISKRLSWLSPHIVVCTHFPTISAHVEFYASPEAVQEEERSPLARLTDGGAAVFQYDDARSRALIRSPGVRTVTYGFSKGADIRGMRYKVLHRGGAPTGISFDVTHGEERGHISVSGIIGETHAISMLAGVAAAVAAGVPFGETLARFATHETPPGRLRLIAGMGGSFLIDDSYNASPDAMHEALKALKSVHGGGKRIAVLGDMLELGTFSIAEHARMGALVNEHADMVVTVGVRARGIAEAARSSGMGESRVHSFERGSDATSFILSILGEGDTVLIKGSQGMRMERITKALMANPEEAKSLLPRQDAEWLAR